MLAGSRLSRLGGVASCMARQKNQAPLSTLLSRRNFHPDLDMPAAPTSSAAESAVSSLFINDLPRGNPMQ